MILPVHQKLRLVQKVLKEGTCVSRVCQENKISRKTFYAWKKKYLSAGPRRKSTCLENYHPKGLQHFRGTKDHFKNEVLALVTVHPEWGSHTLSQKLRGKGKEIGNHGIHSLLKELNLETFAKRKEFALLHRSLKTVKEVYSPGQRRLLSETRKRMVEEVLLAGRAIGEVAKEFKISRKTLWKWAKRYEKAKTQEIQLLISLEDQNPKGSLHPRGTPSWLEQKILDQVIKTPVFSTHQLAKIIPEIGNHGIQNVLLRNGLNKIDMRVQYAQRHAPAISIQPVKTWVGRLKSVFESFVPTVSAAPPPLKEYFKPFFISFFSTTIFLLALLNWISIFSNHTLGAQIGLFFASVSLATGTIFFAYSMKYYLSLALVLSYSSREGVNQEQRLSDESGLGGWLRRIFASGKKQPSFVPSDGTSEGKGAKVGGLEANLDHIKLERYPFISIHLPFYNEKKVANRIISACTSMDYPPSASSGQASFEVIVCDDSTDETVEIVNEWKNHPRVKILHRPTREGFKGGALSYALKAMDPRTEFVCVFDADFVPYPDSLTQFVKYFKATGGWSEECSFKAADIRTMPYSTFGEEKLKVEDGSWKMNLEVRNSKLESPTSTFQPQNPASNFYPLSSNLDTFAKQEQDLLAKGSTAVVAGYQWHVLNKSENWITRGVRTEYSGSYVIERPGQEIMGAMKIIHGSVYCMRADVLKHFGWGTSITEDYELTLRIYEKGFKVCYTPYIQAPSECVSTIKRLIRQRMRWAEGHSFNTRKMFGKLLFGKWEMGNEKLDREMGSERFENPKISLQNPASNFPIHTSRVWIPSPLTFMEKLEFLFLTPYYLQAFLFIIGTMAWLLSEIVFKVRLPFWTALWGWSLILTNFMALPLLNSVGLFLEESEEKDYMGILSFVALCYIVVPFQAFAALKGFIEEREGPWFRTPKTGIITDVLTRGRFYRWLTGILKWKPTVAPSASLRVMVGRPAMQTMVNGKWLMNSEEADQPLTINPYLALVSANNRFDNFKIRPRRLRLIGRTSLCLLLILTTLLNYLAFFTPSVVQAAAPDPTIEQQINIINQAYSLVGITYLPTNNDLGLIRWDSAKYNGDTVYFEAVLQGTNGPGPDCLTAYAALFSSSGTQVSGSEISKGGTGYARVRSAALTLGTLPNLESGVDYTVRLKCDGTGIGGAYIKAARLIIIQTDATSITDTQTQIEVGDNESISGTTYADLSYKKIYRYTSGNFNPAPTVNFEASLKAPVGEGTPTNTGPNNPATGAEDTLVGAVSWGTYTNSFSDNATYDSVSLGKGVISYYNKATNFGFSGIPTDATIKGITVEANGYVSNILMDDYSVKIVKGGTITGTDLAASATDWPTSDTGAYRSYGGTTNLWGTTWSPSDINANTGFGVAFAFKNNKTGSGATYTGYIDHIRITVTYAPAVAPTVYAALYTIGGTLVTGSEVSTTSTSWTRVRTASSITLSDATDYVVRIKTSAGTTSIANAKIILDQTAAGGITALETVHQYINTWVFTSAITYVLQSFNNEFNPANWAGGTFNYYFEATMVSAQGVETAQLYNVTGSDAIDTPTNSQITALYNYYSRFRSNDLSGNSDWPTTAKTLDTQITAGAVEGIEIDASSSWLVVKVSSLQVPENLLLFIPVVIFLPRIVEWYRKRKVNINPVRVETLKLF